VLFGVGGGNGKRCRDIGDAQTVERDGVVSVVAVEFRDIGDDAS
jgi:hypothetical protein